MTVAEFKSKAHEVVQEGVGQLVTTLKVFGGLGVTGLVLFILYVVITQTGPEQFKASDQRMQLSIEALRQSHEKVAERNAAAFEKTFGELCVEMQKDRESISSDNEAIRDTISKELQEGNRTQKRLFERLIGLQVEEMKETSPQPAAPATH